MTRTITIDPVTRIEGHSRITLQLNEAGEVVDAQFHVTQFRGFEKIAEGRPFREMPSLMARICGICPVSHLIASAKACDDLLAVRVPSTAVHLRQILNLAQLIQSHALSFFYLSAPDFLLGLDADPARRNLFGLLEQHPELARGGVRLRQFGQEVIEQLSGRRIHPAWVVPGGVSEPLTADRRDRMLAGLPEALDCVQRTLAWFQPLHAQFQEEIRAFASFPTLFLGLVTPQNTLEHYDGLLRLVDADGSIRELAIDKFQYGEVIGEAVESFSYLKSPYYRPLGYPDGLYRVGPLARLNMVSRAGTPRADAALAEFQALPLAERQSSFYYHLARLIEILYALEQIERLLQEPDILSPRVQAAAAPNAYEGVGIAEAPRGTLLHHYQVDEDGLIRQVNLIIATGHNHLAMNRGVLQTARHFVRGQQLTEGMLNRVEAVIRTFDPCLSCSTHAIGQMPLHVQLLDAAGRVVDEVQR
ncbi:MAG: Ni/Fe hydrogenase subunit alpha [Anaerolineae bacterium]|jgi:NAD-reducing hydrogenase large subunit|nr:Ni/Fe hydrogenase subunit alpha [Anaerolineae bacterium]